MLEIEVKARVSDRKALIDMLNKNASFTRALSRDDTYYKGPVKEGCKLRIRKEIEKNQTESKESCIITYKKKENRMGANGLVTEVNEEHESYISDPDPLCLFLIDSGFTVDLKKHKDVMDWNINFTLPKKAAEILNCKSLSACCELCNVPPLGDFLEVEILSPSSDQTLVKILQEELNSILEKLGLSKNDIEPRYYSELLKEAQAKGLVEFS